MASSGLPLAQSTGAAKIVLPRRLSEYASVRRSG